MTEYDFIKYICPECKEILENPYRPNLPFSHYKDKGGCGSSNVLAIKVIDIKLAEATKNTLNNKINEIDNLIQNILSLEEILNN